MRLDRHDFPPGTGLLFPSDDAKILSDLSAEDRPSGLVILDGTWHQAKTLLRDLPRLQSLPRYKLAPAEPSRFRIRREPSRESLSTLEAAYQSLQAIEPETAGLGGLMQVFDEMVDAQLASPKSNWRRNARRTAGATNVPKVLIDQPERIVVAYGEQEIGGRGRDGADHSPGPVFWVARNLAGDRRFECLIDHPSLADAKFVSRMRLSPSRLAQRQSPSTLVGRWNEFLRPTDRLIVPSAGAIRMMNAVGLAKGEPAANGPLAIKSIRMPELAFDVADDSFPGSPELPRAIVRLTRSVEHLQAIRAAVAQGR